jgi:hypothetical protein
MLELNYYYLFNLSIMLKFSKINIILDFD